jgi:ATP-dependent helicase/nuclease subunit B
LGLEASKQVQYVVFSTRDEHNVKEAYGFYGNRAVTVTNFAYEDVQGTCSWTIDVQLKLAESMSCQTAREQNSLSPRDAIALAPELLKVAMQCKAYAVSLDNLEEVLLGNAPKHVEDLITHLPQALQALEDFHIKSTSIHVTGPFRQSIKLPVEDESHESPIFILAPDRVSVRVVRQIKELMQHNDVHLVLKTIDMAMSKDCWSELDDIHPSFQQKQLLEQLRITRDQMQCLTTASEAVNPISMLFNPATHVAKWAEMLVPPIDNICYAECRSIRQEALVVLIKAKQMLDETHKPVAIVCDDDKMIKVLSALSKLFELNIGVTQGLPLRNADHINFLQLVFQASYTNFAPVNLVALLRHKLFALDLELITLLETKYLRGLCRYNGLDELITLVSEPNLAKLMHSLRTKFANLLALVRHDTVEFSSLLSAVINVATRCSHAELSYDSLRTQHYKLRIVPQEFLEALHILITNHRIHFQNRSNDEAQQVVIIPSAESLACLHDNVIITGLNEGTTAMDDGLLPIISKFIGMYNIETEEHKRARNLFYLLHKPKVLLTRSYMLSGSPQVPSRWLVRLKLLEKKAGLNLNAQALIDKAESMYRPEKFRCYDLPAPTPKLTPRLTKLSVTQVEQLMRDPYGVYAKQILRLKPLENLDRAPTHADFGQFLHACINEFSKNYDSALNDQEHTHQFNRYAEMMAARMLSKPEIRRLWMIRISRIAEWIINFERTRQGKKIYTEVKGSMSIPLKGKNEFVLTCIADRIEVDEDRVTIIDFKTGTIPTDKDLASYMSPQLPLEGMILMHGIFEGISSSLRLQQLTYIKLGTGSEFGKMINIKGNLEKIVSEAKRGLIALIEFYNDFNTPFAVPQFGKPSWYSHLERLDELRQ